MVSTARGIGGHVRRLHDAGRLGGAERLDPGGIGSRTKRGIR
jgi:hypothetical protein